MKSVYCAVRTGSLNKVVCVLFVKSLKEERRLRVLENRVLRGIFGPTKDEVTRKWRKLHNVEFDDLYSLTKYYSGKQS